MSTKRRSIILGLSLLFMASLALTGCREPGPAEEAGRDIDEAIEDARDGLEELGDEAEEALEEAEDRID